MADVLNPVHRRAAYLEGIFINIFQPKHDSHLNYLARRMRKARVIDKAYANLSGLTVVVVAGKKTVVKSIEDLEEIAVAKGRSMAEFSSNQADPRIEMETN